MGKNLAVCVSYFRTIDRSVNGSVGMGLLFFEAALVEKIVGTTTACVIFAKEKSMVDQVQGVVAAAPAIPAQRPDEQSGLNFQRVVGVVGHRLECLAKTFGEYISAIFSGLYRSSAGGVGVGAANELRGTLSAKIPEWEEEFNKIVGDKDSDWTQAKNDRMKALGESMQSTAWACKTYVIACEMDLVVPDDAVRLAIADFRDLYRKVDLITRGSDFMSHTTDMELASLAGDKNLSVEQLIEILETDVPRFCDQMRKHLFVWGSSKPVDMFGKAIKSGINKLIDQIPDPSEASESSEASEDSEVVIVYFLGVENRES